MGAEVGTVSKRLATVCTAIGLVPGVRPHVALQEPGSGEGLPANIALVVQVVSEDVHG